MFRQSFSSPLQRKGRSVCIGPRSTIHLSGPHNKYPTFIPCIFVPTNETWKSSKGRCDYQGINSSVSNALWCGCKNGAGYWLLLLLTLVNTSFAPAII